MTADEAKAIADGVNQEHIDRADGDLNHVQIEISESAALGKYGLEYTFDPSKDYSLVNEIRNQLDEAGFEVEISGGNSPSEGYILYHLDFKFVLILLSLLYGKKERYNS